MILCTVNPFIFASINFREFPKIEYSRPFIFAIYNENLKLYNKSLTGHTSVTIPPPPKNVSDFYENTEDAH